jgi:hypothetical protein
MENHKMLAILTIVVLISGCKTPLSPNTETIIPPTAPVIQKEPSHTLIFGMKGVAIELPQEDFDDMKKAGIDILATEWGMEEDVGKTIVFLDKAHSAGLKVVMDGGFSARAWGFTDEDWNHLPAGKRPVWQKDRVQEWIMALKDHPAVYAWDICNEFGENLPSGAGVENSDWPQSMITIEQIKQAKADVHAADPTKPIHIRMYGWDIGKMPSHISVLLDNKIADIISLNLYSNYLDQGNLQWPTVIADAGGYFVDSIKQKAPGVKIWISLAAFQYTKIFQRPTTQSLMRDINNSALIKNLDGITFFCWGPVSQWDDKGNWYLPTTGADLWRAIQLGIAKLKQGG